MSYTLKSLDVERSSGNLTSLIFHIPFPAHVPAQFLERYKVLRIERQMEEGSHYEEASGRLALEIYNEDSLHLERETWTERATAAFRKVVDENNLSLRHIELVLPTDGIATPLNLFACLKDITNLESLCPMRGYPPMTFLLMAQWSHILEDDITPNLARFTADLITILSIHSKSLKRLRISLPQSTAQKPFSALSINVSAFPSLPALEIFDFTHWSPHIAHIKALLSADGPVPNLQHLIFDHGTELPLSDFDDGDDEEVGPDYDWDNPPPQIEEHSWPALGMHIATHRDKPPLRSLSAALHDARYSFAPVGVRLDQAMLQKLLRDGAGAGEGAAALDGLVVCTAWPIAYERQEPGTSEASEGEEDLYLHAPGCGHLVYPTDQRPTTGLWSADTEEARAMQSLAGRPWY
ncbi:hypothetical protein B0H16DRAFT_1005414 [Mycena metata]|uniref:Uncharacterized protein n=1 Tax=Mycena metata TaxID=1033252 RepID=A0AAD7NVA1_9AGAR|nr:hypothetical protein B0H16DRAFT_1005414 [Mycena metata]